MSSLVPSQPRPQSEPLILQNAIQRLQQALTPVQTYPAHYPVHHPQRFYFDWDKADIAVHLTPTEAHFWLSAMLGASKFHDERLSSDDAQLLIRKLSSSFYKGDLKQQDILIELGKARGVFNPSKQFAICLLTLFPIHEVVVWLYELYDSQKADLKHLIANSFENEEIDRFAGAHPAWNRERSFQALVDQTCSGMLMKVGRILEHVFSCFQNIFWPYCTNEEIDALKQFLYPRIDDLFSRPHKRHLFLLADRLGLHNKLLKLVESWNPEDFKDNCNFDYELKPQHIILRLENPDDVKFHMHRLDLKLTDGEQIRGWLARTEFSALNYIRDSILPVPKKRNAAGSLIAAFGSAKVPEIAPYMLELSLDSKDPEEARAWMRKNPVHTIAGLVPIAAGSDRLAKAAVKVLRELKLKGYETQLETWIDRQPPEISKKLREILLETTPSIAQPSAQFDETTTPDWLKQAIATIRGKVPGVPRWAPLEELPPIRIGEVGLNPNQTTALLAAIKESTLDSPHPLLAAIKAQAQSTSMDAFATKLFERWQQEDMPAREKWVMCAMGHLGSEAAALKLAPLVIAWRSELKHQRVTWGLDALKAMDSDTALMQLHSITQKSRHPGLRDRASEHIKEAARLRGLSMNELEDRIVPDCGLDAYGKRMFDFGPRQFQFVMGAEMKPMVRDAKGKLMSNLPKPGSKDDADLAGQAVADWKVLKKQIDAVIKTQSARLEQVMVTESRWTVAAFERWLVQHPLMTHLVQRLVWAGYDFNGDRTSIFRVAEDQTYTNLDDELMMLDGIETVGIIHALQLTPELSQQWSQLWSDYELFQPFSQLERDLYFPTPEEQNKTVVTRFKDITIPGLSLVGSFERQGWLRGSAGDGGGCNEHSKVFSHAGLIVCIEYDGGIAMWDVRASGDIKITDCYFAPLRSHNPNLMLRANRSHALPLSKVNPIVFSEVMRDITHLAAKSSK